MILVVIEGRFWRHVRFIFALEFVSKLLNASKVHPCVPKKHDISCMKRTIAPLYSSKTCIHRRFTVPHPSSTPFLTIFTPFATLEMLVKPMKNNEKQKTQQISDTISTSINEGDSKAHFTNETSKKSIFNSDLKAIAASFFENVPLAQAKTTFYTRQCTWAAAQDPQTYLLACFIWHAIASVPSSS